MALTCVLVVRMCFLTLVAASLLEEESSALHHEEALAKTAKTNGGVKTMPELTTVLQSSSSSLSWRETPCQQQWSGPERLAVTFLLRRLLM